MSVGDVSGLGTAHSGCVWSAKCLFGRCPWGKCKSGMCPGIILERITNCLQNNETSNMNSSSLHFPKSNGQIKRAIQTINKALKKAFKSNGNSYLAVLPLRTSPGPDTNTPSATSLNNRTIRKI